MKRSLLAGTACALSALTMSPTASAGVYIDVAVVNVLGLPNLVRTAIRVAVPGLLAGLGLPALNPITNPLTFTQISVGGSNLVYVIAQVAPNQTLLPPPGINLNLNLGIATAQVQVKSIATGVFGGATETSVSTVDVGAGQLSNLAFNSSGGARDMGAAIMSRF